MSALVGLPDIALCGKAGAGIGEAGLFLTDELGYRWVEVDSDAEPAIAEACCSRRWWILKGLGYVMVRIKAPRQLRLDRVRAFIAEDVDLDDTQHLDADYTITNDGTKAELYDELLNVIVKERKKR